MMTRVSEHGICGGRKPTKVDCSRLALRLCACNFLAITLLAQTPPVNLDLPNTTVSSGISTYQASNSVKADNGFVITGTANVTFNAGNLIHLGPGFQAATGSAFHAMIGVPVGGGSGSPVQPVSASASPTSGPGPTMFTFVTSYPGNWQNIDSVYILLNGTLDGTDACYILYSQSANAIYLRDDPSTEWMGGIAPQTPQTILKNNQCSLDVASSTVSHSGSNLTINLSLSFNSTFNGVQNVFMDAYDTSEGTSGYYQMPIGYTAYTANPQPPTGSVTLASGSGSTQTFTFHATSVNGYRYLSQETIQFSTSSSTTANACSLIYLRGPNVLYLVGDGGTGWVDPPLTPGAQGKISNSQCAVDSGGSAVATTNGLDLPVYVEFNPAFAGAKTIYQALYDHTGQTQGWQPIGTWTVPTTQTPLKITTSSLPGGMVTQGYSPVTLQASGGTGSYTFSSSSMPPGLSVSAAGVLTGTPTQWGTYSDVIVVVNDGVSQAPRSFTIAIAPGPLTMQTTSLLPGTARTWYQQQLTATGGYPNYVWTVTGLPSGLTATSGGLISGYPAAQGNSGYTANVTVQVTDTMNHSAPATPLTLTLSIGAGQLIITNVYPLPSATVGQPYSFTFTSTGGGQAPLWSIASWNGSPVYGLNLDFGTSGLLHGIPSSSPNTAGDHVITVQATVGGSAPTQSFALSVKPGVAPNPTVTCSASPSSIALGGSVTFTATGTNGTPGYTYLWSAPAVQGGSTLSFTPQATQIYTATVGITDAAGRSNNGSCSVNVTAATGAANLIAPAQGSTLTSNLVTFRWDSGMDVSQYTLSIGTDSNATDILNNAGQGMNLYATIPIPANRCNQIFVNLGSLIGETLQTRSYQFSKLCTLPKEYIRLGGRVIAIENP